MKQIWQETAKLLEKVYDPQEAENVTYLLLEDVFKITRTDILAGDMQELNEHKLYVLTKRLLDHEPIQYVTGIADFYERKFHLTPGALIPRPETEELCELIIRENELEKPEILDVGTGSGCIAITLALNLKAATFGTDVSDEALIIASRNADILSANVSFKKNDVLKEDLPVKSLDILVSNPPYIPFKDRLMMQKNVLDFEPQQALFVPDDDPILFYKAIADKGIEGLKTGGKLYFEIHEQYGNEVKAYLESVGYSNVLIYQDMQGKDRMISATNSANK